MVSTRRPVLLFVTLLAAVFALVVPAGSALAAERSRITISNVSWSTNAVDVTSGPTSVSLTWAVTDTNAAATQLTGTVLIQQYVGDSAVGPALPVKFAVSIDDPALVYADPGSTAQSSTYRYDFFVLQYGAAEHHTWRVTKVTAADNAGTAKNLGGGDVARLEVTGLVDTTAPRVLDVAKTAETPTPMFDSGAGVTLRYIMFIDEPESGFWKGRVTFSGPGGARITVPLRLEDHGGPFPFCGDQEVVVTSSVVCDVVLNVPAGSPSGTWSIAAVVLTNSVEVSERYLDANPNPVQVTRNDVLSASDFSLTPTEVDNRFEDAILTLSMQTSGVHDGLPFVNVESSICGQLGFTPTLSADGTATVQLQFPTFARLCTVNAIWMVDGAGNVAVYGTSHNAPPLDLSAHTVPSG